MRALLQRVRRASVAVDGQSIASIDTGLLLFLGIHPHDNRDIARWLSDKVLNLRIFDERGKMNRSVLDVQGGILVVSQFTLYAETVDGRRPNFSLAASRDVAEPLYEYFVELCRAKSNHVETGRFGAPMEVSLINWGPVTLWVDSAERKKNRAAHEDRPSAHGTPKTSHGLRPSGARLSGQADKGKA
ncbi:D-tyrosyl-tRNA(Tyr) deacylase [Sulfobacillus thermotolerans]|uniref:D-aminoacyl-tRNA deacylase n=1 Tax=Sulfobacillus thermotolerans TaxID=338644 RepID=A0ABN5H1J0_9FIRM|nr:D-tyrosyl-tRNA(Tyr) deacylase [Sulfobacillus thermotolerans]